ncbi:Methyltransferase domain-containing protein [Chitinophaga jiangningensis]|uniref:Methyltransferase domain-containing protein n=1 Tax=Chitinophaga jiangningensis TaxID=1419482 RepID=A0A1M7JXQ5_9BACT|nr:methyltransferase domain-containing protein [Chitinophaga jiangningensis]SHM57317.1 Methyltransferase domain-containing protein [Chitinophaga jiangningensis]
MSNEAGKRAEMPSGTAALLDERSVEKSNANLLKVLQPGQRVLDVGCGSGAITQGICKYVGASGHVTGLDSSKELISLAKEKYSNIPNLSFIEGNLYSFEPAELFDVVTMARTLQWLAAPAAVISRLAGFLRPGGTLCILDYNHTKIEFTPAAPASMQHFYDQFLRWRADAGMDNEIADNADFLLSQAGFENVSSFDHSILSTANQLHFPTVAGTWTVVAQLRGPQLVADQYVTEEERLQAIEDYQRWIGFIGRKILIYERAIHGVKPQ